MSAGSSTVIMRGSGANFFEIADAHKDEFDRKRHNHSK